MVEYKSLKYYAKKYGISVMKNNKPNKPKSAKTTPILIFFY